MSEVAEEEGEEIDGNMGTDKLVFFGRPNTANCRYLGIAEIAEVSGVRALGGRKEDVRP